MCSSSKYSACLTVHHGLNVSCGIGTGTSNNYAYLVKDDKTNDAVIIDPANPPEYANRLNRSTALMPGTDVLTQGGASP